MDWFPHQATARSDPKLIALRRSYGPIGEVVWWHLVEVCTLEEGPISVYGNDYKTAKRVLDLEPEWRCDLKAILQSMVDLGLVVHGTEGAAETWQVARLKEYIGPASERREAWRNRKRKQREKERTSRGDVTASHRDSHGGSHDTELTSTPTETLTPLPPAGDLPKLPRQTVRTVACPECGAPPGAKCANFSGDYERESNHLERSYAYVAETTRQKAERREVLDACATCGGRSFILDENDVAVDCPDCAPSRLRVVQ